MSTSNFYWLHPFLLVGALRPLFFRTRQQKKIQVDEVRTLYVVIYRRFRSIGQESSDFAERRPSPGDDAARALPTNLHLSTRGLQRPLAQPRLRGSCVRVIARRLCVPLAAATATVLVPFGLDPVFPAARDPAASPTCQCPLGAILCSPRSSRFSGRVFPDGLWAAPDRGLLGRSPPPHWVYGVVRFGLFRPCLVLALYPST